MQKKQRVRMRTHMHAQTVPTDSYNAFDTRTSIFAIQQVLFVGKRVRKMPVCSELSVAHAHTKSIILTNAGAICHACGITMLKKYGTFLILYSITCAHACICADAFLIQVYSLDYQLVRSCALMLNVRTYACLHL